MHTNHRLVGVQTPLAFGMVVGMLLGLGRVAAAQPSTDVRSARLIAMARLDGAVRYFHPLVATSRTAWDSLFAAHVVQAADAPTSSAYHAHVGAMLAGLEDAVTKVENRQPLSLRIARELGVLVARPRASGSVGVAAAPRDLLVVLDLRGGATVDASLLAALGAVAPPQYAVTHSGLVSSTSSAAGGYTTSWRTVTAMGDSAPARASAWRPHVSVVGDAHSIVPPSLLALRAVGRLSLVGVATPSLAVGGSAFAADLGEGARALVRTSKTQRVGIAIATDSAVADSARAFALALSSVFHATAARRAAGDSVRARMAGLEPITVLRIPPADPSMQPYPSRGYRVLAAVRVWNTFDIFSPYKALFTTPWSSVLAAKLPEVERATDAQSFNLAIATLVKETNDGHSTAFSQALTDYYRLATTPFQVRFVEGKPIVVRIGGPLRDTTSLQLGDELLAIDGQPVAAIAARYSPYVSASTPQGIQFQLQWRIPAGPAGSIATFAVRGADGARREIRLQRPMVNEREDNTGRGGPIIRMLPDSIGYVDLERLPPAMVDSVFMSLGSAKAIIFDMRGYPQGTGRMIAERLITRGTAIPGAHFDRPVRPSPDSTLFTASPFDQMLSPSPLPKYAGRTVMLIDERAGSQSEHTGLGFEAANGTQFIGSPTLGQNGDVTDWIVPGNIRIRMSGQSVKFADGRQLQRVGLTPHIAVSPTVRGLRAGVDEVLSAAHRHIGGRGDIRIVEDKYVASPPTPVLLAEPGAEGWSGPSKLGCRIGVDTTIVGPDPSTARASAHVTVSGTGCGATYSQLIRADDYRGKRVRLSGWLKTRNIPEAGGDGAGLWLRIDGRGTALWMDNMAGRRLRGTEWTKVSAVADVPHEAVGMVVGLMFVGVGEGWLDDLSLEVVDATVPVTRPRSDPANGTASELRQQIDRYSAAPRRLVNGRFDMLVNR